MGAGLRGRNGFGLGARGPDGHGLGGRVCWTRIPGWIGFISSVAEFTPKSVETTELRSSLVYEIRCS